MDIILDNLSITVQLIPKIIFNILIMNLLEYAN